MGFKPFVQFAIIAATCMTYGIEENHKEPKPKSIKRKTKSIKKMNRNKRRSRMK